MGRKWIIKCPRGDTFKADSPRVTKKSVIFPRPFKRIGKHKKRKGG